MMLHTHGTWGERVVTRETPYGLTTILFLDPNKRCSWHKHKHSFNQFYVISGVLEIKTDIGPDEQINITVEEIAYVEYDKTDIDREALGGDMNE
jgi:mannose-6-phosphate isomerase-like protein (cupin superfamily)